MKRSIVIVLTIALLGSGVWYWENNRYVEYVPTIRGSDMSHSLKELSDLNNNDKHRNAMIQILEKYNDIINPNSTYQPGDRLDEWGLFLSNGDPIRNRLMALTGHWIVYTSKTEYGVASYGDRLFQSHTRSFIYLPFNHEDYLDNSTRVWLVHIEGFDFFLNISRFLPNLNIIKYEIRDNVHLYEIFRPWYLPS